MGLAIDYSLGQSWKIWPRSRNWSTVTCVSLSRRLDQLLASLGYCSRREAKAFIKAHSVTVEGRLATDPATKVDPAVVLIEGEPLDHPDGFLLLMHKPAGYICSHDAKEGPSIYSLFPDQWLRRNPRIETIGRLDRDTTGAILLTDDGQLNHRLTSPTHHVDKVYRVTVNRPLDPHWIETFANGTLQLDGEPKPCRPAELEIIDPLHARLTLVEGKYHQVKRMFAAFGTEVTALHRERFGAYTVDDLAVGRWRDVSIDAV